MRKAIAAVPNGTTRQRCDLHFLRDVSSHLPTGAPGFSVAAPRAAFQQTTIEHAREAMNKASGLLSPRRPHVAAVVREAEDDALASSAFPGPHRRQVRSTNPPERLHEELCRRTRVVGIFRNDASALRLVGMLLDGQHEGWIAGDRRCFGASSMRLLTPAANGLEDRHAAR